jgi:citrate synthase
MKKEYMIYKLSESIKQTAHIDADLFKSMGVKRGLRNEDHSGVLVGLTKVGDVVGYERLPEGGLQAVPGKLIYRGIDVEDLSKGVQKENRFGFEETAYLLLSGGLPDKEELTTFNKITNELLALTQDEKMNILFLRGSDIMNILARQVLVMDSMQLENILKHL